MLVREGGKARASTRLLTGQGVSLCRVLISRCLDAHLCLPSAPPWEPGCLHPRLQTGQRKKVSAFSSPGLRP